MCSFLVCDYVIGLIWRISMHILELPVCISVPTLYPWLITQFPVGAEGCE